MHSLVVARAGYDIAGSPLRLEVTANAASPANCVVDARTLASITPLVTSSFSVTTYDRYNNLRTVGDEDIVVTARVHLAPGQAGAPPPPAYETVDGTSLYVSNGRHTASYAISTQIVTRGGQIVVDIKLNNGTLPGSPFAPHLLLV